MQSPTKYLLIFLAFWAFALLKTGFLVHFTILGSVLQPILIAVCVINFVGDEKTPLSFGIFAGVIGGIMLDLFSAFPFGTFALTLGLLAFLIKKISSLFHKSNLLALSITFLFTFLFYNLFSPLVASLMGFLLGEGLHFYYFLNWLSLLSGFFYNLILLLMVSFLFVNRNNPLCSLLKK